MYVKLRTWHCMCTKVGSSPRRKIYLLGVAHLVVGKLNLFQVPEAHRAMRLTRDLNREGKAGNALFVIGTFSTWGPFNVHGA